MRRAARHLAGVFSAGVLLAGMLLGCLLLTRPALAQDAPWAGQWDMRWPDGGARVVFTQHGADVTGTYRLYDGHLVGRANGDRLEGTWDEGDRHGGFVLVLGPRKQGFAGRFDDGAWWTGERTDRGEVDPEIRDATPAEALRSFLLTCNYAAAGHPDVMADAIGLLDFGPGTPALDARQRLVRARAVFAALDLTTFRIPGLPRADPGQATIVYALPQAGTDIVLPLTLSRRPDGHWRIEVPAEHALAQIYHALLQRHGGRPPVPDAAHDLRSPRDTMRSLFAAIQQPGPEGRARVLETLDLSQVRDSFRTDQGLLQAQYMVEVINRIGAWVWQEIPDDPASREPYVFFDHPAGRIVMAPQGTGEQRHWRFTSDTVESQLRLFVVTEDVPPLWGVPAGAPYSDLFAFRARLAAISPLLLARSLFVALENWQVIAFVVMIVGSVVAALILVPLLLRGVAWLFRLFRQPADPALFARFRWPLRLIAVALIWFRFRQRIGITGPGLILLDSVMGVVIAIGLGWAGLPLVDAVAHWAGRRARRSPGSMDDILVSLTAGLTKLGVIVAVAIVAAQAVDLPLGGMLAGLGIGGLAVAFASKEALSNLFGAAILLADRPFTNGDNIAIGDVQGTVEHVGIRSTRIRTMDDTVIILPNGKLSDALINNFGARRHRLFRTKFKVDYEASPDRLEAFTRRLREVVDVHPSTAEERTQVGLWQLNEVGVEIDLMCYFRAGTLAEERAARHELLLQVMRLAEESGVHFAVTPTA